MSQNDWIIGLFFAALGAILSIVFSGVWKYLRALPGTLRDWRARENESDFQAAQRIAGSTQRLVILLGIMMLVPVGMGCFSGGMLLGWAIWTGRLPPLFGLLQGLLLGSAGLCWYVIRFLEKVAVFLTTEDRERLGRMN